MSLESMVPACLTVEEAIRWAPSLAEVFDTFGIDTRRPRLPVWEAALNAGADPGELLDAVELALWIEEQGHPCRRSAGACAAPATAPVE